MLAGSTSPISEEGTMGDEHIHGCWVTGADRVCEDGTKGCSREHPRRNAGYAIVISSDVPLITRENVREVLSHDPLLADAVARELEPGGAFDPPPPVIIRVPGHGSDMGSKE